MNEGIVEAINIAAVRGELPHGVDRVDAVAGQGLPGDRYYRPASGAPEEHEAGLDLTLIEAEALQGLEGDTGIRLSGAETRRQVLTRGIRLNDLVGKRFAVGEAVCVGRLLCEPCAHLQSMTQPGVLRGLVHRGGLRADVLEGGAIAVGDPIRELPE